MKSNESGTHLIAKTMAALKPPSLPLFIDVEFQSLAVREEFHIGNKIVDALHRGVFVVNGEKTPEHWLAVEIFHTNSKNQDEYRKSIPSVYYRKKVVAIEINCTPENIASFESRGISKYDRLNEILYDRESKPSLNKRWLIQPHYPFVPKSKLDKEVQIWNGEVVRLCGCGKTYPAYAYGKKLRMCWHCLQKHVCKHCGAQIAQTKRVCWKCRSR